jgi:glyoxylase-like metal-dependent hydrolase (beta-lactamase superfamily II)
MNSTCILYRIGSTVVDIGPPNQWPVVRRFLEERDVGQVLVTHHHEDHSGNLAAVSRAMDPKILVPEAATTPLAEGFPLRLYQRIIWGRPEPVRASVVPAQIDLDDGKRLQTIAAPGHSVDSTCFLEPDEGWLFSGDLYITRRPLYLRNDENVAQTIETLRRVLELDFDTVFCAHRGLLESGKDALRQKLDYLVSLCEEVRELRSQGRSAKEITRRLLGREGFMSFMTGLHFSKRNLVEGCLAVVDDGRNSTGG